MKLRWFIPIAILIPLRPRCDETSGWSLRRSRPSLRGRKLKKPVDAAPKSCPTQEAGAGAQREPL